MTDTSKPSKQGHPVIDTQEFARTGLALSGAQAPTEFPRLLEALSGPEGRIAWRLSGERRARPEGGAESFMVLDLEGEVQVPCIRCLKPVQATLGDRRLFKLALTEREAVREDADTDDYDVIVDERQFDVLTLVEDEAILALPIAPRHDDCSLPDLGAAAETPEPRSERPNPFAALAGLKSVARRGGDPDGGED